MNKFQNNEGKNRFELETEDGVAVASYRRERDSIIFTHTEVPPAAEGKGIGSALAKQALEFSRQEGLAVVPLCSFIAGYIKRHPEYLDLVPPEHRSRVD